MQKDGFKAFLRSLFISLTVIFCIVILFSGTAAAYRAINETAYGEYKTAFEFKNGEIRIFDYRIKLPRLK